MTVVLALDMPTMVYPSAYLPPTRDPMVVVLTL